MIKAQRVKSTLYVYWFLDTQHFWLTNTQLIDSEKMLLITTQEISVDIPEVPHEHIAERIIEQLQALQQRSDAMQQEQIDEIHRKIRQLKGAE